MKTKLPPIGTLVKYTVPASESIKTTINFGIIIRHTSKYCALFFSFNETFYCNKNETLVYNAGKDAWNNTENYEIIKGKR